MRFCKGIFPIRVTVLVYIGNFNLCFSKNRNNLLKIAHKATRESILVIIQSGYNPITSKL